MRVTPLIASTFATDGGTMFGLVPKPIWSRRVTPDSQNRIPQHAHVLLVELDDGRIGLVDTGCGAAERFSEKEQALHGLGPGWPLLDALRARQIAPDEINFIVFTHLHWDHAGGNVAPPSFARERSFPKATLYVHEKEWEDATSRNPLLYKSYPPETIDALRGGAINLIAPDESEILPGIWLHRTSGHTRGHCAVRLTHPNLNLIHPRAADFSGVTQLLLAGDVCPTQHNLRMVFQTSYDTFPLDTRIWKRDWLPRIARKNILLLFDHDPEAFGATLRADPKEEFAVERLLPCT
ncbi:MAG: MBL fold metallo-hydrolase [Kiritimatiellae bacterium]|nr:MBL fold metallo-hydrolase [Kiritimatiellia bacterium]